MLTTYMNLVVFLALIGFSIWLHFRDSPSLWFKVLEKPPLILGRLLQNIEEESRVATQTYQNLKPYEYKRNDQIHIQCTLVGISFFDRLLPSTTQTCPTKMYDFLVLSQFRIVLFYSVLNYILQGISINSTNDRSTKLV